MKMNDFLALDISADGMRAQRMRLQVIAENLANQQTTGPNGPYRRKEVVFEAAPATASFDQQLGDAIDAQGAEEPPAQTVRVAEVRRDGAAPIRVYKPDHPHAGADGYVELPNISIIREMTDMIEASRMYEANLAASKTTQDMLTAAMDLLKR